MDCKKCGAERAFCICAAEDAKADDERRYRRYIGDVDYEDEN